MTTDTLLVQRAARGDREAFDAVFDASFGAIHRFAARHATGPGAEPLCERILERAFRSLEGFEGDVPFAAWLLAVARQVTRELGARPQPARRAPSPPIAS